MLDPLLSFYVTPEADIQRDRTKLGTSQYLIELIFMNNSSETIEGSVMVNLRKREQLSILPPIPSTGDREPGVEAVSHFALVKYILEMIPIS